MNASPVARLKILFCLAACTVLSACGGGGDSPAVAGGGGPAPAPAPTPAPSPPPAPTPAPAPASPTGLVWHTDFTQDFGESRGSFTGRLVSGERRVIDSSNTVSPVADGTTYATFEYDFRDDITVVAVKRVGVTQPLSSVQLTGYARDVQISPSRSNVVLARWGSSATSNDDEWTVLDLNSRVILNRHPGGNTAAGWLPDGRFLYLSVDQTLSSGSVGATSLTPIGQLATQGVVPRSLRVNLQGTQVLYRLVVLGATGNLLRSDLWVSQIDASNVRQLTETGVATFGMWSPDGQHVAFMHDTGAVCTGPDCAGVGTCVTKLAPSNATRLTLGASDVTDIRLRDAAGVDRILGCSLLGWTP